MRVIGEDLRLPPLLGAFPASATLVDVRSGDALACDLIWTEALRRAGRILAGGVDAGDAIVVAHADPLSSLLDLFGVWTAGCIAVLVHPGLTGEEKERICEATEARLWLGADAPILADARSLRRRSATAGEATPARGLRPDDPALILMSSGTTGRPKGIVHTLRSLSARIALNLAYIGSDDLARALNVLPVHFGHGLIGNCLTPLAAGARLLLWGGIGAAEYPKLGALIEEERITFMSSVPSFWRIALRVSPPPAAGLRRVHVGSAPLDAGQWNAIADWAGTRRVLNMYGMTETANWIAGCSLEEGDAADGLVGRAWGGRLAVLRDGSLSETGEGEIVVQSPSIMRAYHQDAAASAEAFFGAWFRTGDVGRIGGDGRLTLVGRIKDEINRAGMKIAPAEIDLLLARHPDVVDACAFGIPDPVAGETVGAAVVLREGARRDPDAIIGWCRDRIRSEAVPQKLFVMAAIPRTERGKISRRAVQDAALGQRAQ